MGEPIMNTQVERVCAYLCAAGICITALLVDGPTATVLAVGVAASLAGGAGYVTGRIRRLRA